MKFAIDTNSLLALVRYYLPFDDGKVLYNIIKEKIETKEIILIDKVNDECKRISQRIIFDTLKFEDHKKVVINSFDILPDANFFRVLENNFCNKSLKDKFTDEQFETEKEKFLESADAKLVLMGYHNLKINKLEKFIIVSEETSMSNDRKIFKKIPFMCRELGIEILTLPKMLQQLNDLKIEIKKVNF